MQTQSTSVWNGLPASLTQLALDYARARYVDVERYDDDRNIPDEADLRYRGLTDERGVNSSLVMVIGIGVVVLIGGALLLRR